MADNIVDTMEGVMASQAPNNSPSASVAFLATNSSTIQEQDSELSLDQIRETLNNFQLDNEHESQIVETNVIDNLTRLLNKKEADLKLAVRMGKELLTRNQKLENDHFEATDELQYHIEYLKDKICKIAQGKEEAKIVRKKEDAKIAQDISSDLVSANEEIKRISEELEKKKKKIRVQEEEYRDLRNILTSTRRDLTKTTRDFNEVSIELAKSEQNLHEAQMKLLFAEFRRVGENLRNMSVEDV